MQCADCGGEVGKDRGPPDGWQLEDGRTVCHACCVKDTARFVKVVKAIDRVERQCVSASVPIGEYSSVVFINHQGQVTCVDLEKSNGG